METPKRHGVSFTSQPDTARAKNSLLERRCFFSK